MLYINYSSIKINQKEYPIPKSLKRVGLFMFTQTAISYSTGCCPCGRIASANTQSCVTAESSLCRVCMQLTCSTAVLTFLFSLLLEI